MYTTVGSPNPASASLMSRTPVAHNDSAVPIATISTGTRLDTNSTTTAASTTKTIVLSATTDERRQRPVVPQVPRNAASHDVRSPA